MNRRKTSFLKKNWNRKIEKTPTTYLIEMTNLSHQKMGWTAKID